MKDTFFNGAVAFQCLAYAPFMDLFSAEEEKPAPAQEEAEHQAYIVPPPPPLKPQPGLVRLAPEKFLFVNPPQVNQPEPGLRRSD